MYLGSVEKGTIQDTHSWMYSHDESLLAYKISESIELRHTISKASPIILHSKQYEYISFHKYWSRYLLFLHLNGDLFSSWRSFLKYPIISNHNYNTCICSNIKSTVHLLHVKNGKKTEHHWYGFKEDISWIVWASRNCNVLSCLKVFKAEKLFVKWDIHWHKNHVTSFKSCGWTWWLSVEK